MSLTDPKELDMPNNHEQGPDGPDDFDQELENFLDGQASEFTKPTSGDSLYDLDSSLGGADTERSIEEEVTEKKNEGLDRLADDVLGVKAASGDPTDAEMREAEEMLLEGFADNDELREMIDLGDSPRPNPEAAEFIEVIGELGSTEQEAPLVEEMLSADEGVTVEPVEVESAFLGVAGEGFDEGVGAEIDEDLSRLPTDPEVTINPFLDPAEAHLLDKADLEYALSEFDDSLGLRDPEVLAEYKENLLQDAKAHPDVAKAALDGAYGETVKQMFKEGEGPDADAGEGVEPTDPTPDVSPDAVANKVPTAAPAEVPEAGAAPPARQTEAAETSAPDTSAAPDARHLPPPPKEGVTAGAPSDPPRRGLIGRVVKAVDEKINGMNLKGPIPDESTAHRAGMFGMNKEMYERWQTAQRAQTQGLPSPYSNNGGDSRHPRSGVVAQAPGSEKISAAEMSRLRDVADLATGHVAHLNGSEGATRPGRSGLPSLKSTSADVTKTRTPGRSPRAGK
jgi:hypothetical protein